jgi:hypothetical protein
VHDPEPGTDAACAQTVLESPHEAPAAQARDAAPDAHGDMYRAVTGDRAASSMKHPGAGPGSAPGTRSPAAAAGGEELHGGLTVAWHTG